MAGARAMRGRRQWLRECNQSPHHATSAVLSGTRSAATFAAGARTGTRIRTGASSRGGTGTVGSGANL